MWFLWLISLSLKNARITNIDGRTDGQTGISARRARKGGGLKCNHDLNDKILIENNHKKLLVFFF